MMAASSQFIFSASAIIFFLVTILSGVDGIWNGQSACPVLQTQFPYLTFYKIQYIPNGQTNVTTQYGTGTLITPSYVLIGAKYPYLAHMGTFVSLYVVIGACDPNNPGNATIYSGSDFTVDSLTYNQYYNPDTNVNNTGFIRLPREATGIRPATLVSPDDIIDKSECFVAGYGSTQNDTNLTLPQPAMYVQNPLICTKDAIGKCEQSILSGDPTAFQMVNSGTSTNPFFCAGYFNSDGIYKGPCGADLSAPLQCNKICERGELDKQVVVGFVLFPGCGLTIPQNGTSPSTQNGTSPSTQNATLPSIIGNINGSQNQIANATMDPYCLFNNTFPNGRSQV